MLGHVDTMNLTQWREGAKGAKMRLLRRYYRFLPRHSRLLRHHSRLLPRHSRESGNPEGGGRRYGCPRAICQHAIAFSHQGLATATASAPRRNDEKRNYTYKPVNVSARQFSTHPNYTRTQFLAQIRSPLSPFHQQLQHLRRLVHAVRGIVGGIRQGRGNVVRDYGDA